MSDGRFPASELFKSRYAAATFALVAVHQSIIASAAYFLTEVIERFQAGDEYASYLILYFLAMTIPFIPGCASYIALQKWENAIHRQFVSKMQSALSGRIWVYKNEDIKTSVVGMVSRNSFSIVNAFCSYLHSSLTFLLNSVLSIAVISVILPKQLTLGYVASAFISMTLIYFASPAISRKAAVAEASNIEYGTALTSIWSNTTLGNSYSERVWNARVQQKGGQFYEKIIDVTVFRQLNNMVLGLGALIPTMYLIYAAATSESIAAPVFAAIIVNLTRIVHILNSFGALVYQVLDLQTVATRAEMLRNLLSQVASLPNSLPANPRGVVRMNGVNVDDFALTAQQIAQARAGRFVITGDNGTGKSMLLLHLKNYFGDAAFLLPVDVGSLQWKADVHALSTGQRLMSVLAELVDQGKCQVLLLDEWDANLDKSNKQSIDEQLDTIARRQLVVEVRHSP